ncbi:hypothetical protein [Mucilaginibacter dorajii]|uniref:Uncharacterized protein n=1 Tax=Mucilaginibacter dorajii TaxID=692994 RepID=A0ABP7PH79_9SPHI|nr:hypothetical protein [Mucilaginibacter dorajii]MCS3735352.1 hypothetical protein [Mucilaginibacter dorajii]
MGFFITNGDNACKLDNTACDDMGDSNSGQHNNVVLRNKPGGHNKFRGDNNRDSSYQQLHGGAGNDNQKTRRLKYFEL